MMRRFVWLLVCCGVVTIAAAPALAARRSLQIPVHLPVPVAVVPSPHVQSGAQALPGNVLPALGKATPQGDAPSSEPMRIGVVIAHPHASAEDAAVRRLYNPSSAKFHAFLTPAQYAQKFGISKSSSAAVRSWLKSNGLTLDYVSGARDYYLATGTVAEVEALTHTQIGRYSYGGVSFLAGDRAPQAPAGLHVLQILGLNTYQRFHTTLSEGRITAASGAPNIGAQSPKDLWSIYQQPASQTGRGVSVAILGNGATDSVIKDLHQFDKENGLPQVPVDVVHTPRTGDFSDTSGNEEWNIDMQAIHGMAPGITREVLYFAPTLADTDLVASTATWVNDRNGPPIMNASLGECEVTPAGPVLNNSALDPVNGNENPSALPVSQGLSNSSEPAQTQILRQAAMEGRTLFASSGDSGSSCTIVYPGTNGVGNYVVPLTEDPADSPYAVGVGGTVLYSDGGNPAQRTFEYAWTHSGGNASPFIAAPSWQQGVANLNRPCVSTGQLCRGVPDVAAISGDVISNGYTIVAGGQDSEGGGTSLSSPLWAGMWARVVGATPGGRGVGFANPAIYAIGKDPARYAQSFYDITAGTNGLNPAQTGWDYVTGFGAPKLSGLLKNVLAVSQRRR